MNTLNTLFGILCAVFALIAGILIGFEHGYGKGWREGLNHGVDVGCKSMLGEIKDFFIFGDKSNQYNLFIKWMERHMQDDEEQQNENEED